jgi:hypothetical protein
MEACIAHRNVKVAQKITYVSQKENLEEGECLGVIDYGQAKSLKMKPEEDSHDFFNKLGISVIACVLFIRISGVTYKKICCFFSMCNIHTAQSSIDYIDRVLDFSMCKGIRKLYLWSDNGGHFKNNDVVMHLRNLSKERNMHIQYNQFCEYEGKDCCDQFFGSLSNGLENHTRLKPVLDINDLLDFSTKHFKKNGTNEYVFEIYHPVRSTRDENHLAVENLDDYLLFEFVNGKITAAVLTAQPHTPPRLKQKPVSQRKNSLVYPAKEKEREEETEKDKRKRRKKENFYHPHPVGGLTIGQYNRRGKAVPGLKEINNTENILNSFKK